MTRWQLRRAVAALDNGGIVAYPTEAVYGLGCEPLDPVAVMRLLALKRRPVEKGLILIASDLVQLEAYIEPLSKRDLSRVRRTWPGPVTWLLPKSAHCPAWLSGAHDTIACRVTAHPVAAALCGAHGGALVSTSANPAGHPPARTPLAVRRHFGERIDWILHAPCGGNPRPSQIRALDGHIVRD